MGKEIVVGLHFYQPPREAVHPSLKSISTDPERKNWTSIIARQCYEPLAQKGVLDKASFDIYQSLLIQLENLNPSTAEIIKKSMKENGVGESFIHPILPNLSPLDKSIVISAGVKRFKEITGQNPKIFWPPETAIDTETLETLEYNGYEGFVCAPEQIVQQDGRSSDNQPTIIRLTRGRQIVAYPFDRSISSQLAFDKKENADTFALSYIEPKISQLAENQAIIAWTDAETFGHHYQDGDKFLSYLLDSSLPSIGLYPVSINNLCHDKSKLPVGKIVERSAWSCPHGNLKRWSGPCDCGLGEDNSWKQPFSQAMDYLNDSISIVIQREIGIRYSSLVAEHFYNHLAMPETVNTPLRSLVSAKISSLIANTSCATFFSNPQVSGNINLLYAYQALLYLKDSGLTKTAASLKYNFYEKLANTHYPSGKGKAMSALKKMLDE
jgi:hypothetical protein